MPAKYDRMVKHIKRSCRKRGGGEGECRRIAYATATKKYGYRGRKLHKRE